MCTSPLLTNAEIWDKRAQRSRKNRDLSFGLSSGVRKGSCGGREADPVFRPRKLLIRKSTEATRINLSDIFRHKPGTRAPTSDSFRITSETYSQILVARLQVLWTRAQKCVD